MILTENYGKREIFIPFNPKNMEKSIEKLKIRLEEILQLSPEESNHLENTIYSGFLQNSSDSTEEEEEEDKFEIKKEVTVNKYSHNREGDLFESVILDGKSLFLSIYGEGEFTLQPFIEEKTRILYPPFEDEYLHEPYEFESEEEIKKIINLAKKETVFTLFKRGRSIISRCVDQEIHVINLISADQTFSYFQDRFNTVHYTGIFGDNGTGKSSIGDVAEATYYRSFNTTDPTAPNIFRSLGNVEPGQITLILDEAEKVDQSADMIGILKSGYSFNKKVSRINPNTGKPELFFAYCQKMIIGERPPNPNIAKGVNDRILGDVVYYGNPQYDIKEILNPTDTGGEELKEILREIAELRKLLLIYRMLHFRDRIKNINIGLSGRNKELVKPYLQLFSNFQTDEEKEIFTELENTFQKLLEIKNNKKDFSLESALIPIIIDLMYESKIKKIKFSDFWQRMMNTIRGKLNEYKPNEYNTEDYGTIYRNTVTNTLRKLGVSTKHHNSYTELLFDHKKIMKSASQYCISIQTKIGDIGCEYGACSERYTKPPVANNHCLDERPIDLSKKIGLSDMPIRETNDKNESTHSSSKVTDVNNVRPIFIEPSQPSLRSPEAEEVKVEDKVINSIYRIGKTDTWGCKNCNLRDDRWFMRKHPCRGS